MLVVRDIYRYTVNNILILNKMHVVLQINLPVGDQKVKAQFSLRILYRVMVETRISSLGVTDNKVNKALLSFNRTVTLELDIPICEDSQSLIPFLAYFKLYFEKKL
jgi:hypothetical protein